MRISSVTSRPSSSTRSPTSIVTVSATCAGGVRLSGAASATARYIAPVSRYVEPSRSATARATRGLAGPGRAVDGDHHGAARLAAGQLPHVVGELDAGAQPRVGLGRPGGDAQRARRRPRRRRRSPPRRRPGGPLRSLADPSAIGSASTAVAFSSWGLGRRTCSQRPGISVGEGLQGARALGRASTGAQRAVEDRRAVVDRVVEGRTGEHDAVDVRHLEARGAPAVSARRVRLADEPCRRPRRRPAPCSVGMTAGRPSLTKARWRSAPRRGSRRWWRGRGGRAPGCAAAWSGRFCRGWASVPVQYGDCARTVSRPGFGRGRQVRQHRSPGGRPDRGQAARAERWRDGRPDRGQAARAERWRGGRSDRGQAARAERWRGGRSGRGDWRRGGRPARERCRDGRSDRGPDRGGDRRQCRARDRGRRRSRQGSGCPRCVRWPRALGVARRRCRRRWRRCGGGAWCSRARAAPRASRRGRRAAGHAGRPPCPAACAISPAATPTRRCCPTSARSCARSASGAPLRRGAGRSGARRGRGRRPGADGVPVERLAVVNGALDGIERVLAARLAPGDAVAVEDPGWGTCSTSRARSGCARCAVAVDERGMLPAALAGALRDGARAAVLTPRGQNPTGAALDADARRRAARAA